MPQLNEKILQITGRGVHVPGADIDTDRIIPARFMKCVDFSALGPHAFEDVREDARKAHAENPSVNLHPFDRPENEGASILIADSGFGAGSSREHAPQSLMRWGIRAIVALSVHGLFRDTCTVIGIPCVTIAEEDHSLLVYMVGQGADVTLDLEQCVIVVRNAESSLMTAAILIPPAARQCLMNGTWDPLAELADPNVRPLIDEVAKRVPPGVYEAPTDGAA